MQLNFDQMSGNLMKNFNSEVPIRWTDGNKQVWFEKSAKLLAYLLSKSINEQGGIFHLLVGFEKSAKLLAYLLSKSINEQGGIFRLLRETRISIRILFGNTADCGILMEFFNNFD